MSEAELARGARLGRGERLGLDLLRAGGRLGGETLGLPPRAREPLLRLREPLLDLPKLGSLPP